jgi:NitT/TauT family transport system permease protein
MKSSPGNVGQNTKRKRQFNYYGWILPFAGVVVWSFYSWSHKVNELFLPSPLSVGKSIVTLLIHAPFWLDILATLARFLISVILSMFIGILLGLIMGSFQKINRVLNIPIDIIRSVPVSALFPLMLLILGLGNASKIALVTIGCAPIVLVDTMYAVINTSVMRKTAAKQMGATPYTIAIRVVFMGALPQILAGMKIAVSLGLVLVLVTEMWIGSNDGLGHRILNSYAIYHTSETYATIILTGLIGWSINNVMVGILGSRLARWAGK